MKLRKSKFGYTLIELSITILIISLLMAGLFSVATGSVTNSKKRITNSKMEQIYKALGTYLMVNKRLPCPASLTKSFNQDADYGNEVRSGNGCGGSVGVYRSTSNTNLFFGAVPASTLNLDSSFVNDDFGNKFSYIIDERFAKNFITNPDTTFSVSSFGTANAYNVINILENKSISNNLVNLTSDAIMVIISFGPNKLGGFDAVNGAVNTAPTDFSELENYISSINDSSSPSTAVYNNNIVINADFSDIFDDQIIYKTRLDFINDFSARNLTGCKGSDIATALISSGFTAKSLYYGQLLYSDSTCSNGVYRVLKCDFGGSWKTVLGTCP
ncbi:MAG: type II secretion system protein [Alphaproteobacteria bacterium]